MGGREYLIFNSVKQGTKFIVASGYLWRILVVCMKLYIQISLLTTIIKEVNWFKINVKQNSWALKNIF